MYKLSVNNIKLLHTIKTNTAIPSVVLHISFLTVDPGAPILNEAVNIDNTSFQISWNEPNVKNGRLLTYNVTIEPTGPLYDVSVDEECSQTTETYTIEVDGSQTAHQYSYGLPFNNYSAFVTVATSVGYGPESNTIIVHTADSGRH